MTLVDEVRQARDPMDALLRIARAVDDLRPARVPTLDSWDGWGEPLGRVAVPDEALPDVAEAPPRELTDDDVKAWIARNYGRAPADDAEGRAIIAQVRADLERAGTPESPAQILSQSGGVVESQIDWSPANARKVRDDELSADQYRALRYQFARDQLQLDVALGPHPNGGDWAEDYAKVGPINLYVHNRDLLVQYNDQIKAAVVADIDQYSTQMGHEVGRDLLKKPLSTDQERGAPPPLADTDGLLAPAPPVYS